jgi:hypothetical protein
MVDVAIAAKFVRELTEEQFEEKRRTPRRSMPGGGGTGATAPATGAKVSRSRRTARRPGASASRRPQASASDATAGGAGQQAQTASRRPGASASRGGRFAATRFGRALYRLAQVRG